MEKRNEPFKETIKVKIENLEKIKEKLKKDFIGIDLIIDQFIENIKIWYVMPDLMSRPIIVNLWGMTGVGKTDLIRKFVKYSEFNDRFIEIQMDDGSESSYSKIQHHLESILESTDIPGILLVDEIQRFRTVSESGEEKSIGKAYSDLWMLLSDGRFESDSKNRMELMDILYDEYMSMERQEHETSDADAAAKALTTTNTSSPEKTEKNNYKYKIWRWNARRLKTLLKIEESVDVIMTWDIEKKVEMIKDKLSDPTLFEGKIYNKLLIIVSGNIDEAYRMSKEVDDVDFDADLFHEYSKKITMLDIKGALLKRFKPEQIARFGNTHILYPSLSRKNYEDIIKLKIEIFIKNIKEKHGIDVHIDKSVYTTVYLNGVFPTQGVRPVLSTVSSILENQIPKFLMYAMEKDKTDIYIRTENNKMIATIDNEEYSINIHTVIENLRRKNSPDKLALIAVHETGHALVYALRFGYVPEQLTCDTASAYAGGFMQPVHVPQRKESIIWEIEGLLAGMVAEEIIFGESMTGAGHVSDIMEATMLAATYVRHLSFDNFLGRYSPSYFDKESVLLHSTENTEKNIEQILSSAKMSARELVNKHMQLYKDLLYALYTLKTMKCKTFIEIGKKHGLEFKTNDENSQLYPNYESMMFKRLNENKPDGKKD